VRACVRACVRVCVCVCVLAYNAKMRLLLFKNLFITFIHG